MKKNTIYLILFTITLNFSFGQNLKDKNILVVWGGWDGHSQNYLQNILKNG